MPTVSLAHRRCPLCNTDANAMLFAQANIDQRQLDGFAFASRKIPEYMHWQLWQCAHCDLLYASPAPPPGQLAGLYQDAEFGSSREARHASRTYGRILRQILPHLPDRAGALDVGAGDGAFLGELLDAGFTDVVGIEPSRAPIETAETRVRPLIRQGLFEKGSFGPEQFTLVSCLQTIEHVCDPLGLTQEAFRILKPSGVFFLIGHNRRSFSAKVLGRRSPIFDIEHLQLFSRASLRRLMLSGGFARVDIAAVINVYPMSYWTQLFPFPGGIKRTFAGFLRKSGLGKILIPLPAGNLAAIAYKLAK